MTYFNIQNKWFVWPLFLFLFTYIVLRAWFVEPILDEIATIYNYIENKDVFGGSATMDANNHVLNSYSAKLMNLLFGDHFFSYRLLSIVSFPIYFFSAKWFINKNYSTNWSSLIFVAIVTIPWITDYFSLCRGYGASLSFFLLAMCLFQQWKASFRIRNYFIFIFVLILTIASNLSLLVPIIILFFYSLALIIICKISISTRILSILGSLLFIAFMIPAYIYIGKLKKAGALWWGSRDGLWAVTGKSLSRLTLFCESELWKYVFLILFTFILVVLIKKLFSTKFVDFITAEHVWVSVLFGGSLVAAIVMATFMGVNYPMDRVGMYLVPLFIMTISIHFAHNKYLKWSLLSLLWFPLTFVMKLNLNTTIFSPEDRIEANFYKEIKKHVRNERISAEYVLTLVHSYSSRKEKIQQPTVYYDGDTLKLMNYYLAWHGIKPTSNYRPVLSNENHSMVLYQRIHNPKTILLKDTTFTYLKSNTSTITLLNQIIPKNTRHLQIQLIGSNHLLKPSNRLELLSSFLEQNGKAIETNQYRFSWYFGSKKSYRYDVISPIHKVLPNDNSLVLSFDNPEKELVELRNIRIKLYKVVFPSESF